jgi:curli production assembly/transport component CsgG
MLRRIGFLSVVGLLLAGCAHGTTALTPPAALAPATVTALHLDDLAPPATPVDVAVYAFPDLTGQAKPNESFAEYSRAVTQGGASILVDVLTSAGGGDWFRVVERVGLENLVQERTIIENTQRAYGGGSPLPPVRFAGIVLEGGIVGYDSNETTGGAGARFLGIGGDVMHRSDTVTVNLRAVSVQNGEVLLSTTTTKQIYSVQVRGGAYRFISGDDLLEIEVGMSHNDPGQLAVREALELAVYSLIVDGLESGLWSLRDPALAPAVIAEFQQRYE